MSVLLKEILEMPNAALLAEQTLSALKQEQEKRRHFYEIIEEDKKMEFINGEVIFREPSNFSHIKSVGLLSLLLSVYVQKHQLGFIGAEKMLISLTRNDYEPDICFFESLKSQGFTPTQMQFPAPDFVVEVLSDSTKRVDRETKFQDYAAHGIAEYWIIDPEAETIEQYFLQEGSYELLLKSNNGEVRCVILSGLIIPIRAVFDEQLNLEVLGRLLAK
jgi:Uma2 family endonuclease